MVWKKEKEKISVESEAKKSQKLIRMERPAEDTKAGPLTADVHPDEVGNFEKAGWKRAK